MAYPLYEIEVRLVGDNWIVLEAGREIASHRRQRDALDHAQRLLGIAEGDVEPGDLFGHDGLLSDDAGRRGRLSSLSGSRRPSRQRTT